MDRVHALRGKKRSRDFNDEKMIVQEENALDRVLHQQRQMSAAFESMQGGTIKVSNRDITEVHLNRAKATSNDSEWMSQVKDTGRINMVAYTQRAYTIHFLTL